MSLLPKMILRSFSFKFLVRLYASDLLLTFLPLVCQFGSPEVVLFAGARFLEDRVSIVPWLSAVLRLVSSLSQVVRSRQFYNVSSRCYWECVVCSPWKIDKVQ